MRLCRSALCWPWSLQPAAWHHRQALLGTINELDDPGAGAAEQGAADEEGMGRLWASLSYRYRPHAHSDRTTTVEFGELQALVRPAELAHARRPGLAAANGLFAGR